MEGQADFGDLGDWAVCCEGDGERLVRCLRAVCGAVLLENDSCGGDVVVDCEIEEREEGFDFVDVPVLAEEKRPATRV